MDGNGYVLRSNTSSNMSQLKLSVPTAVVQMDTMTYPNFSYCHFIESKRITVRLGDQSKFSKT